MEKYLSNADIKQCVTSLEEFKEWLFDHYGFLLEVLGEDKTSEYMTFLHSLIEINRRIVDEIKVEKLMISPALHEQPDVERFVWAQEKKKDNSII